MDKISYYMKSNAYDLNITNSEKLQECLKILKDYRKAELKLSNINQLSIILNNIDKINCNKSNSYGIIKSYDYSKIKSKYIHKNLLNVYDFLIDSIISDNGSLFNSNKIYQLTKINPTAIYSKYDSFLILAYLFLNMTKLTHKFYDEKINYDANYNRFFCIINYFIQIKEALEKDEGHKYLTETNIIIHRKCYDFSSSEEFLDEFLSNNNSISKVILNLNDSMYDLGRSGIECDFANKYLGGGVLKTGRVQEEIKFTINTELISAMFYNLEPMKENECIIMIGTDCFSNYTGYCNNFKFIGNCFNLYDSLNKTVIQNNIKYLDNSILLAIDAHWFKNKKMNYDMKYAIRDLKKSFVGFSKLDENFIYNDISNVYNSLDIVSGKWGCGAFNGDPELKFIIQLLSCSINNRNIIYSFYNDYYHFNRTKKFMEIIQKKNITVKDLFIVFKQSFENSKIKSFYDEVIKLIK